MHTQREVRKKGKRERLDQTPVPAAVAQSQIFAIQVRHNPVRIRKIHSLVDII